jgi:hypothetical protein
VSCENVRSNIQDGVLRIESGYPGIFPEPSSNAINGCVAGVGEKLCPISRPLPFSLLRMAVFHGRMSRQGFPLSDKMRVCRPFSSGSPRS